MICRWKAERGDGEEAATSSTLEKRLGDTLTCLPLGGRSSPRTEWYTRSKVMCVTKNMKLLKSVTKKTKLRRFFLFYRVYA